MLEVAPLSAPPSGEDAVSPSRSQTVTLACAETGKAPQNPTPLGGPTPARGSRFHPTDDDLLHFALWWVTENRGRGPDFVAEVAIVFRMLKAELPRVVNSGSQGADSLPPNRQRARNFTRLRRD